MTIATSIRLRLVRLCATACLVMCLPAPVAWAGISPQPFRTGLFGVTTGQSIRVSILNAGHEVGIIQPCVHVWSVAGRLLFARSAGELPEGVGTFADFTPPSATAVASVTSLRARAQVFAEVVFAAHSHSPGMAFPPDPIYPPDPIDTLTPDPGVLTTLEVFETTTGRTVFTMPFAAVAGVDPQPFDEVEGIDPTPFRTGLFGVKAGQAVRVSVLNTGEADGIIGPSFRVFDLNGKLLFKLDGGPLPSGTGVFRDFEPLQAGTTRVGLRAQVRVEVELIPGAYPADLVATALGDFYLTLEVFDPATGQTVYTMPFLAVGFKPQPEPPEPVR